MDIESINIKKYFQTDIFKLIITLTILIIFFTFFKDKIEGKNDEINNGEVINDETSLPPFVEPNHFPLFEKWYNHQYHYDKSGDESDENDEADEEYKEYLKEYPEIQDIYKNFKFKSIFDVCYALRADGKFNEERDIINNYISEQPKTYNEKVVKLIKYLEETLMIGIKKSLEINQYDRAKWLGEQLTERLLLIDCDPLNNLDTKTLRTLNKMYLTSALIQNSLDCFLIKEDINELIPTYSKTKKRITISLAENKFNKSELFKDYKLYWTALIQFHNQDYEQAKKTFSLIYFHSESELIKDLSVLVYARCLLWDFIKNKKISKIKILSDLTILSNKSKILSFRSDIEYYINFIKNDGIISEEGKNVGKLSKLNKNDLIDALIEILQSKKD